MLVSSLFPLGLMTCHKLKMAFQDFENGGANSCCESPLDTLRHDVADVCDVTVPGEAMTGWSKAGYTSYGLLKPRLFAHDGHLQWHTWELNDGSVTYVPTYARLPDLPSCGPLPISNEFFYMNLIQQMRFAPGEVIVKSRINGKWYNFPASMKSPQSSAVSDLTNANVGLLLSEPWKVAKGDVTASSSIIKDGTLTNWPPTKSMFSTSPDNQVYASSTFPSRSFFHYAMTTSIYDSDCKRFRFNDAGKTGILGATDWYLSQSADYHRMASNTGPMQMNKVYRDFTDGRIGLLENVKEFSREYFVNVITEGGEALMSPTSGDGEGVYGLHINSAYGDGTTIDSGFSPEWYGPFYDYPHKWFHNEQEYGSTAVVPRFKPIYRLKPAADGSMHNPTLRVESSDPSVSPFNDAHTFIDGSWGDNIVDVDGYIYPRDFSFNGNFAHYYSHRFDSSRSPMVSGGGGDAVVGGTQVGYVPPGDYLRPMVKKSPSGEMAYIKVTGTPQTIKDRTFFSYNNNNFMILDDDGYVYMTGVGTSYASERLKELKQMYPDDFVDALVDNGVVDSETFAHRVDFAEDIYDAIMQDKYYNGDATMNSMKRHGSVSTIVASDGLPIAAELNMYAENGVATGLSVHHRIVGPNYALPVKVRINGEGERVYMNANDYSLVHEAKNICKPSDIDCDEVSKGAVFYKKDGTIWHWDFYAGFDLFQMSVNGQGATRSSSNPPTQENPVKPTHVVTTMSGGVIANVGVSCRDFPSMCTVDATVPFTPSTPVPLSDFCSKNADGKTPCKYDPYNPEEKPDYSATCYGYLYERKASEDATEFIPYRKQRHRQACTSNREDQMVDYTNQNVNSSNYDTAAFPQDTKLSFADACKLTCAEYNTPLITFADARTMTLDMTGATSFTVKGSDVPKLRSLTLVNTEHLTSLTLDGVKLRNLVVPMTENLALSAQGDSALAYLKLTGTGSVSVSFLNALDGKDGVLTSSDIPTLPVGTPLLKGAMRYIDLADTVSVSGDMSGLQLLQLYKFRARGISTLDLDTLMQGCPKLVDLDVDTAPTQVTGLTGLGSFGAHFGRSYTFLSNGNSYPNRQIKLGALSDLSSITNLLSGKYVTHLRADAVTAGSGAHLARLAPTVRSIRLTGAIAGNVDLSRFTHLETLSISSTGALTLNLDQSFGHQSCASLKTLQLLATTSSGWTGSLTSLGCYKLNVLQISGPSLITGTFHDIDLSEARSLAVAGAGVTGSLKSLSSAHKLHHLDLTSNGVTGDSSSLSHLSDLNQLTLNDKVTKTTDMMNACGTITVVVPQR